MIIKSKRANLFRELSEKNKVIFPCGGGGTCGKCKVKVLSEKSPPIQEADRRILSQLEIEQGYRLACHMEGTEEVEVLFESDEIVQDQDTKIILHEGKYAPFLLDPVIRYSKDEQTVFFNEMRIERLDIKPILACLVVDIGSTTIVVSLVDVERGMELATMTSLNPQRIYGQDVMSRITAIQRDDKKLKEMQTMVIETIQNLGEQLCVSNDIALISIYGIFIAGNAVMNHIVLNVSPESLGLAPYSLAVTSSQEYSFEALGFKQFGKGIVMTLPNISAFVGGDIVAGIIATALYRYLGTALLVDIGTNGEMVLMDRGRLYSTSCAAGPALEGMNIACGVTAQSGAIEEASFVRGTLRYKTINRKKAVGICGSGILALIREFLKVGLITSRGNIAKIDQVDERLARYIDQENKRIWVDKKRNIYLSQKDIRQIQLAKGAILSGIQCLLQVSETDETSIEVVYIAGQFGSYVTPDSLVGVGLIPQGMKEKIEYVGNASKAGCYIVALNRRIYDRSNEIVDSIQHVELSYLEDYDRTFAKATVFPMEKEK